MNRIRLIKQFGGTRAIALEPADMKDFNLSVGDPVLIDDIIKQTDKNITKILSKQGINEDVD